eukprot:gnl/TRDRNA2_/TRDRNA2_162183_c0_seq2.p1 gnl/TRDRNA2_/TRDRNA2_162183_c0~~gnl/TRDRNA2_/TRDRNA2_162183_c0_seq2.p1  ORF type:complete len:257 (+),score=46.90 gnl/TRDRNA2_/TRDRNA2_162183_c0_seq2:51-821(+)
MEYRIRDNNPLTNFLDAFGSHEVIVESPDHNALLATSPPDATCRLVRAFRERGRVLRKDERVRHVHYFKNQGGTAGASLVHPHSQVVALPIVSKVQVQRVMNAQQFYMRHVTPVLKRVVEVELEAGARVVDENPGFVAVVPFAALGPFEVTIIPKAGGCYFVDVDDVELEHFASILHRVLQRLHIALDEPNFNMVLREAPHWSRQAYDYSQFYTWHCCLYPRLGAGGMAGFEFGTGIFSNANLPEQDAKVLREVPL